MFATRSAPTWRSYRRRRRGTAESAEFALLQAIGSADPSAKSCVTHRSRSPTGAATTIVAVGSLPRRKTFSVSGPVNNWIAPSAVASNHTSRDCGESDPPATDRTRTGGPKNSRSSAVNDLVSVLIRAFPKSDG